MVAGRILFLDLDLHGCCLCTYSLSYEVLGLVFSICILFYKNKNALLVLLMKLLNK